jgi:hypothetical protein
VVVASVAAALVAVASSSAYIARPTSLSVTFWGAGSTDVSTEVWTLRCNPAGATLPRPTRACRKLPIGGPKLFAPLPLNAVCTEIYGGPQKARVVGRVSGRRVEATFTRADGCQIARWKKLSPWLLPPGGVTR